MESSPVIACLILSFSLLQDMLPEYIHMRVAESILFAGKAIRVLRNPSHAFRFQDAVYHQQMPRGSQKLQGFTGRFPFQKEPFVDQEKTGEELLPQSDADKIEAMLSDLKVSFYDLYIMRVHFVCIPFYDI